MSNSFICGIYAIVNSETLEKYIGSSKDIFRRYKRHISDLKKGIHKNSYLQNSFNKYGLKSFYLQVVLECSEEDLIIKEQEAIDSCDWSKLYNLTKIAGSGGGDVVRKPLYLINLDGTIYKEFDSGVSLAKFLDRPIIDYNSINTKSITKKKWRIVTPEFYNTNIYEIKSWRKYSNESKYRSLVYHSKKYYLERDGIKTLFSHQKSLALVINLTHQRVQQIFKNLEKQGLKKYFHKKTRFFIGLS